eukprot:TRINITY_DN8376_c0_g2_i1.p1 TRINITY_DN8376_c0_g2~~TRINITY_DN8376_c0_g2_i1.p1  ORF type:complete len:996 (+),score=154.04 TRINITY_DN8376_c0_g2_i1:156-3143(+)
MAAMAAVLNSHSSLLNQRNRSPQSCGLPRASNTSLTGFALPSTNQASGTLKSALVTNNLRPISEGGSLRRCPSLHILSSNAAFLSNTGLAQPWSVVSKRLPSKFDFVTSAKADPAVSGHGASGRRGAPRPTVSPLPPVVPPSPSTNGNLRRSQAAIPSTNGKAVSQNGSSAARAAAAALRKRGESKSQEQNPTLRRSRNEQTRPSQAPSAVKEQKRENGRALQTVAVKGELPQQAISSSPAPPRASSSIGSTEVLSTVNPNGDQLEQKAKSPELINSSRPSDADQLKSSAVVQKIEQKEPLQKMPQTSSSTSEASSQTSAMPSFRSAYASPAKAKQRSLTANRGKSSEQKAPKVVDLLYDLAAVVGNDGGPPRWFCPLDARPRVGEPGSAKEPFPKMLFVPGVDGTGVSMGLQHRSLARIFSLSCMHVPTTDRTTFQGLVDIVAERVRDEFAREPERAVFLAGESFGAVVSMAVAAQNPTLPLRLVLVNPATSFDRSPLAPYLPLITLAPAALYSALPFALSFSIGNPLRMAAAGLAPGASDWDRAWHLRDNLLDLLQQLPLVAGILPQDTLRFKLDLLQEGSRYVNTVVKNVKAPTLILASGDDRLLPSKEEANRLKKILPDAIVRGFSESGHTLLMEEAIDLAGIIKGAGFYRTTSRKREDLVTESFVPPSPEEVELIRNSGALKFIRQLTSPVSFSTLEDGTIVQGLEGVPSSERPLLFIGNHQTWAPDLGIVVDELLEGAGVVVRGLAHPLAMGMTPPPAQADTQEKKNGEDGGDDSQSSPLGDLFRTFGAVPVSGMNLHKLLKDKQAVLLFPGGVREAYRRRGEEYQLFWPSRPEFVRMAVKHGAVIIPYAAVGVDDSLQMVLDAPELLRLPIIGDRLAEGASKIPKARAEGTEGDAAEVFLAPLVIPGSPKRLYFLFRKPIRTQGREMQDVMTDLDKAQDLYGHVKKEVEAGLAYLLKKREEDPYGDLGARLLYEASWNGDRKAPTFIP